MNYFTFTSSAYKELRSKLENDLILKKILNQNLTPEKYTNKISSVFCIYQAFAPDDMYCNYPEKKVLRRKTKVLELYMNLDYYKFLEADNKQAKEMMSELYLKGIEKYLIPRKDFKGKEFYHDVKELFEQHKLIKKMPENTR